MLCAISGEAPQIPVASRKSGNVFEKRLIEAYILENGKDPVTGEELVVDDLVELRSSRNIRPRPPTLTSIPSLLSVFQNEWDALALETHTLRQHLTQTRQELSRALYEHDAAFRVITRISRERDEARETLSKLNINGGIAGNGDTMQIDGQELPTNLVSTVKATQERLSKTRRKRIAPEGWVTAETVQNFTTLQSTPPLYSGSGKVMLDNSGDLALSGGDDGQARIFSITQNEIIQEISVGNPITDASWMGSKVAVGTSAGTIHIFEDGKETLKFAGHAGKVTALALHPSLDILASVGVDKSYIFYDLSSSVQVLQISTNCGLTSARFHPDGHLFAAGGVDGQVKVFDVTTGANAANFDESGPIQSLSFSENGTWLAVTMQGSTSVSIWDLRKSAQIRSLEIGGLVTAAVWDYTGKFLATAGPSGITIQEYMKSAKTWSEPFRSAEPSTDVVWGSKAHSLVSLYDARLTIIREK